MTKRCRTFGSRACPGGSAKAPRVSKDAAPRTSELAVAAPPQPPAISDKEGLRRAYEQGDTFTSGKTMYIAGSHTARDWWDDFVHLPVWGDSRKIYRYQMARQALKDNPQVERVVGHSLGGSVALQLQQDDPRLKSRTYSAPVFDPFGGVRQVYDQVKYRGHPPARAERYRSIGDPISFFDGGATSYSSNPFATIAGPHAYQPLSEKFHSEGVAPME